MFLIINIFITVNKIKFCKLKQLCKIFWKNIIHNYISYDNNIHEMCSNYLTGKDLNV